MRSVVTYSLRKTTVRALSRVQAVQAALVTCRRRPASPVAATLCSQDDGASRQTNRCQSGRVILSILMIRLAPVRPFSAVKFSIARKKGSPRNA